MAAGRVVTINIIYTVAYKTKVSNSMSLHNLGKICFDYVLIVLLSYLIWILKHVCYTCNILHMKVLYVNTKEVMHQVQVLSATRILADTIKMSSTLEPGIEINSTAKMKNYSR